MEQRSINQILKSLSKFADIHNKQVAPLLTSHESDIENIQEDVKALYELVEMYFFVFSKAMFTGFFDNKENVLEVMKGLQDMQDYYLACVSVTKFVSSIKPMQPSPEEETEKDEDEN